MGGASSWHPPLSRKCRENVAVGVVVVVRRKREKGRGKGEEMAQVED